MELITTIPAPFKLSREAYEQWEKLWEEVRDRNAKVLDSAWLDIEIKMYEVVSNSFVQKPMIMDESNIRMDGWKGHLPSNDEIVHAQWERKSGWGGEIITYDCLIAFHSVRTEKRRLHVDLEPLPSQIPTFIKFSGTNAADLIRAYNPDFCIEGYLPDPNSKGVIEVRWVKDSEVEGDEKIHLYQHYVITESEMKVYEYKEAEPKGYRSEYTSEQLMVDMWRDQER